MIWGGQLQALFGQLRRIFTYCFRPESRRSVTPATAHESRRMEKSIFTHEYRVFARLLRETRQAAGVTQVQLAQKLRTSQSIVSKWERGELRLDIVQIQRICRVLGATLAAFAREYERRTRGLKRGRR